jgi:hypothetical protein
MINRLQLSRFSPGFVADIVKCLGWLTHIPIYRGSFLLFASKRLYNSIFECAKNHESQFRDYVQEHLDCGCISGVMIIGAILPLELAVICDIVKVGITTYSPPIFHCLMEMCRNALEYVNILEFADVLNCLVLDLLYIDIGKVHFVAPSIFGLLWLISDLCLRNAEFAECFADSVAMEKLANAMRDVAKEAKVKNSLSRANFVFPVLAIFEGLWIHLPREKWPEIDLTLFNTGWNSPEEMFGKVKMIVKRLCELADGGEKIERSFVGKVVPWFDTECEYDVIIGVHPKAVICKAQDVEGDHKIQTSKESEES